MCLLTAAWKGLDVVRLLCNMLPLTINYKLAWEIQFDCGHASSVAV